MFDQMSIKDLAALCGVSTRTLRYYEQMGLIRAGRLENNYRFYGLDAVSRIEMILTLKKSGLELREIRNILGDSQQLEANLLRQRDNLRDEIRSLEKRLAFIDRQQRMARLFRQHGPDRLFVREEEVAPPEPVREISDGEIVMIMEYDEQRLAFDAGEPPRYFLVRPSSTPQTRLIASAFLLDEHRLPHLRRTFLKLLREEGYRCTSLIGSEEYCLIAEKSAHYLWCEVESDQ